MYTECPNCHTFFKVSSTQLRVAGGKVRCGSCNEVFNAVNTLLDEVPASLLNKGPNSQAQQNSNPATVAIPTEALDSAIDTMELPTEPMTSDVDVSSLTGISDITTDPLNLSGLDKLSGLSDISEPDTVAHQRNTQMERSESIADSSLSDLTLADVPVDSEASVTKPPVSEPVKSKPSEPGDVLSDLSDINRDIDNALDGLFDEGTTMPDVSADSLTKPKNVMDDFESPKVSSEFKLDDDLADLDLETELTAPRSRQQSSSELSLDDLDDLEELGGVKNKKQKQDSQLLDDLDLGDSLLDSASLDYDESDWSPDSKKEGESTLYSGDSFILEELDEDQARSGLGTFAKLFWAILIFVLILVLVGQFIYLKRDTLVKYPQFMPILEAECKLIAMFMPCEVPARRALEMVELVDRNIVSHPSAENALLITATIRSDADFVQPFPKMVLTFSDINEKVVARREFTPEEYLAPEMNISKGMEISVPVKIILEIVDPGEEAVNFEFDFK